MQDCKYVKLMYLQMLNDINTNPDRINWASKVRDLLYNTGFGVVWLNQGVQSIGIFIKQFNHRIKDNFMQNWDSDLETMSRACT